MRILAERADWIWVEPVGPLGEGIEFILHRDGREEHHQVKRQKTGQGHWTLGALKDAKVLANFKAILDRSGNPRFISGHDAHELHELADRARKAVTFEDFSLRWLGETWTNHFRALTAIWGLSEAETYEALLRCDAVTVGDDELDDWNRTLVEGLIEAPAATALSALVDVIANRLQARLDARALWDALAEPAYGLSRRVWAHASLRQELEQLTRDYVEPLEVVRLRHPIARPEVDEALDLLRDGNRTGVLLAGPAGAGKSDVISGIVERLQADGWLTLAMRVDRMVDAARPEGLGDQLGLPGSPAAVLGAVAKGEPSLLIVDQLDAVSLASGRLRRLWEPVYALLREAQAQPGVRLLLACRQFDLDNDHRLRQLTGEGGIAQSVIVGVLGIDQIKNAVRDMGMDPEDLSDRQLRLMDLPLHLALLEPLVEAGDALAFTTANELFDAFWHRKRLTAEDRLDDVDWTGTLRFLSERMSETRRLSLPKGEVDAAGHDRDARALISEHVLVEDGRTIAFFHESFFDYTYARYFVAQHRSIMDLLIGDEQDLFRRAQVRQILLHERSEDAHSYATDLRALLASSGIRFHLKQLSLALLGDIEQPTRPELEVLTPLLEGASTNPLWWPSWRVFMTPAWFKLADEDGLMSKWLGAPDASTVNAAVRVLGSVAKRFPARAAELLQVTNDGSEEWLGRRAFLVRMGNPAADQLMFDHLIQHVVELPLATDDEEMWMYAEALPAEQPAWAATFLRAMLDRAQQRAEADEKPHAFHDANRFRDQYWAGQYVRRLAGAGPVEFLEAALPWMLATAAADVAAYGATPSRSDSLAVDRVWGFRTRNARMGFKDALLDATVEALTAIAAASPRRFQTFADQLAASTLEVAQFLLYEGIRGNPAVFADWTVQRLLESDTRWRCGYNDDVYWATRELISAIAPHLSPDSFAALEAKLGDWTPEWEKSAQARQYRGHAQFTLLSALDPTRLSKGPRKRLGELQRKFGRTDPEEPQGIIGGAVVSPISGDSAAHMSDDDWIRAIVKHRESWEEKRTATLIGGARQLAQTVQNAAQQDPQRWVGIGLRLPNDVLAVYFEHLLIGLAQPVAGTLRANAAEVFELLRKVAGLPDPTAEPYWVRLVASYSDQPIPDDLIAGVAGIAIGSDNPNQELWRTPAPGGDMYYGGDPWHAGMNSTRGAAAEAIGRLVAADETRVDSLMPAVESLANDPSVAVRTCAAEALGGLARWRRDTAAVMLTHLVNTDEMVFAARPVHELIAGLLVTHWANLLPVVEQMMASGVEDVRQAGARLACLGALQEETAGELLARAVESSDAVVRRGAAQVAAANLLVARFSARCREALTTLLDDDDEGVRDEAGHVFLHMQAGDLAGFEDIARAALTEKSYPRTRQQVLHAIERSTADVSDLILLLAGKILDENAASLSDVREGVAGDAKDLSSLLVRVLGDRESDVGARTAALDCLDRLCEVGAWGTTEALSLVDR